MQNYIPLTLSMPSCRTHSQVAAPAMVYSQLHIAGAMYVVALLYFQITDDPWMSWVLYTVLLYVPFSVLNLFRLLPVYKSRIVTFNNYKKGLLLQNRKRLRCMSNRCTPSLLDRYLASRTYAASQNTKMQMFAIKMCAQKH